MRTSTRWTVVVLAVVVALGVGLWTQLDRNGSTGTPGQEPARGHRDVDTAEDLQRAITLGVGPHTRAVLD